MFRKLLKIGVGLLPVIFIIGTLAFTAHESKDVVCQGIEIEVEKDDVINVDKSELVRLVKSADKQLLDKKMDQINSEIIEDAVEKHQAILNAEVYKIMAVDSGSIEGVLTVKVDHRDPVLRIMSDQGSYYLDEFGGKIPTSSNYTANVLVTTGYFTETFAKKQLLSFALYIENDDFWQAQIEQIHVEKDGEVLLTPLVGNHIIEFGDLKDYEKKLRNMRAFYEQVLVEGNWNKYKTVSLKYNKLVVAKKR